MKVMHSLCVSCVQTGEKLSVAIKTCKNCSADVKEKFLSEASECAVIARLIYVFIYLINFTKPQATFRSFAYTVTEQAREMKPIHNYRNE